MPMRLVQMGNAEPGAGGHRSQKGAKHIAMKRESEVVLIIECAIGSVCNPAESKQIQVALFQI